MVSISLLKKDASSGAVSDLGSVALAAGKRYDLTIPSLTATRVCGYWNSTANAYQTTGFQNYAWFTQCNLTHYSDIVVIDTPTASTTTTTTTTTTNTSTTNTTTNGSTPTTKMPDAFNQYKGLNFSTA